MNNVDSSGVKPLADMAFSRQSLLEMLGWGAKPETSPYSHYQIAEWCDMFWREYVDIDVEPEIERLLPLLADVETQMDLYLVNTYSLEELRTRSFKDARMPVEWFEDWIQQLCGQ